VSVHAAIHSKLTAGLCPVHLEVVDESDHHLGHAGHRVGGESHFRVTVIAAAFAGKSRLERHRMVNTLLAEELAGPVHALSLVTQAPEEAAINAIR
jgi:BolA family transcriptional regulator, general stress-responsive regulator